jgi:cytochrome c oxidase subunit 2
LRIPAFGGSTRRLAKLAPIAVIATLVAACSGQENSNPTGDGSAPSLFGETANGIGFPHEVVTTEGIASAGLYLPIFLIAVAIFILIEGLLLFMAWRFRRKGDDSELPEQTHGNNKLEFIWTAIPAAIVTVLFIGSAMVLTDVQAKSDDPDVVVNVEAFRFGWKFDYDNGVQVAGGGREGAPEMVLPIDKSVLFRLTAADVIHSFYVPSFFFKLDAIPGRTNEFEITIEKPGVYGGQCAEFCGLAHSDMFFSVRAVEPAEYETWVTEQGGDMALAGLPEPDADAATPDETLADTEEAVDEVQVEVDEPDSDPGEPDMTTQPSESEEAA